MSYLLVGIEDRSYAAHRPAARGGPLLLSNARNGPGHEGPARGGGAEIQGLPEARGGDQQIRAGDGISLRRGNPRRGARNVQPRARGGGVARRSAPRAIRALS